MLSRYWLLCALHDASRDTVGVGVAQMRPGMRPDTSRLGCVPGCGRTRPGLDASRDAAGHVPAWMRPGMRLGTSRLGCVPV